MNGGNRQGEHEGLLAKALASVDSKQGFLEALTIESELRSMLDGGAPGEAPREAFLRLCDAARDAYRFEGSQADILNNEAARPLLRYLLDSLARYREMASNTPKQQTADAYRSLAVAFRFSGTSGARSGVREDLLLATCHEYSKTREQATNPLGRELHNADDLALRAAYKVRYRQTYNKTLQEHRAQMGKLAEYLAYGGYRWGRGHSAWNRD